MNNNNKMTKTFRRNHSNKSASIARNYEKKSNKIYFRSAMVKLNNTVSTLNTFDPVYDDFDDVAIYQHQPILTPKSVITQKLMDDRITKEKYSTMINDGNKKKAHAYIIPEIKRKFYHNTRDDKIQIPEMYFEDNFKVVMKNGKNTLLTTPITDADCVQDLADIGVWGPLFEFQRIFGQSTPLTFD